MTGRDSKKLHISAGTVRNHSRVLIRWGFYAEEQRLELEKLFKGLSAPLKRLKSAKIKNSDNGHTTKKVTD